MLPNFKDTHEALDFGILASPADKLLLRFRRCEYFRAGQYYQERGDSQRAVYWYCLAQFDHEALCAELLREVHKELLKPCVNA